MLSGARLGTLARGWAGLGKGFVRKWPIRESQQEMTCRRGEASARYGIVAQGLHWVIAILVGGMLILGKIMIDMPDGFEKLRLYQVHKSFGFTVLALMVVRLAWRLTHRPPPLPPAKPWEHFLARLTHGGLYVLLLAMPMTGWLTVSASPLPIPTRYFDLFTIPDLTAPDKALRDTASAIHSLLSSILIALLALHIAAALKHHFVNKDDVLLRITPFHGRGRGRARSVRR